MCVIKRNPRNARAPRGSLELGPQLWIKIKSVIMDAFLPQR